MRQVTLIECITASDVDHALNSSWSGYDVRAIYHGVQYDLWLDVNSGDRHEALMCAICPSLDLSKMGMDAFLSAYHVFSNPLTVGWQKFESYPTICVE